MRGDILKKKLMVLCAVAIMISTCLTGCKMNSGKIRFGSAGIGGTYQIFGDTFANLISSKSKKYNIEVKTTAGSAANLRLLSKDYIQMAVAQMDLINDASGSKGRTITAPPSASEYERTFDFGRLITSSVSAFKSLATESL